jgi:hypothetical protein
MGNPDIILIFGGTNDAWTKTTLQGDYKYADWTYEDLWYFRPAFACLVGRIKANFPNARIINIMNNGRNGKDDAEKGLTLAEFAKMIGISATTFSLVISSGAFLRQPTIIRACNVLGIDRKEIPSYFFTLKV